MRKPQVSVTMSQPFHVKKNRLLGVTNPTDYASNLNVALVETQRPD